MGGLYNLIFGVHANADALLEALGLSRSDFYRFRDCYVTEDNRIAVYTRGGGGNRECYCSQTEEHDPYCAVPMQEKARKHPLYLADEDDDFDNTYATFYFRLPEKEWLKDVPKEISREELWKLYFKALKGTLK